MREHSMIPLLILLIAAGPTSAARSKRMVIESRLFRGGAGEKAGSSEVVVSSASSPQVVLDRPAQRHSETRSISELQTELNTIYRMRDIEHVASNRLIWNGKEKRLAGTVTIGFDIYSYHLHPRIQKDGSLKLRVVIRRLRGSRTPFADSPYQNVQDIINGMSLSRTFFKPSDRKSPLLNTEIRLKLGDPVVLGFPSNGETIFLSLAVTSDDSDTARTELPRMRGSGEEALLPPLPVYRVAPPYPETCRRNRIGGRVILAVTTDPEGRVASTEVTHRAHPDLERAAAQAVRRWRYRPAQHKGRPIPAQFSVTIDFKLGAVSGGEKRGE